MRLRHRYLYIVLTTALIFLLLRQWRRKNQTSVLKNTVSVTLEDVMYASTSAKKSNSGLNACSMANCFNWTKCLSVNALKVYIYPSGSGSSDLYEKILSVLRESYFFTSDPNDACLFVLAVDTIYRDKRSDNYVKDVNEQIDSLPPHIWQNGTNHLIFNLYYGSFPDYDYNLGFDAKNAMIAWASANTQEFRVGFDVSFPLFHKEHPFRTIPQKLEVKYLRGDQYVASFKGKRYVFGIGSETRNILYKLHDNVSSIIATTCKHTALWKKFEDDRCEIDNENYDRWDYNSLLKDSTFCFTPRGRRLGSFRFLEALGMGCIPVVLSDDWLLPLFEVIDWSGTVIPWHERNVLFISDYLSEFPRDKIFKMKRQSLLLYHRHFSSIEKMVISSIESIFDRIRKRRADIKTINWNSFVDFNSHKESFTIVLQAILRDSSRLNRIIAELSMIYQLNRIIVLWPKDRGPLPKRTNPNVSVEVLFVETPHVDQSEYLKVNIDFLDGDFVLFMDERIPFSPNELDSALRLARNNPTKIIAFYTLQYFKKEDNHNIWSLSRILSADYSFALLHLTFLHKSFIQKYQIEYLHKEKLFNWFTPYCHIVLFNFLFADWTLNAPIWVRSNNDARDDELVWMKNHNESACFNKIVHEMYNNKVPLISSKLVYTLQ